MREDYAQKLREDYAQKLREDYAQKLREDYRPHLEVVCGVQGGQIAPRNGIQIAKAAVDRLEGQQEQHPHDVGLAHYHTNNT